ncbi:type II toxin-antitoxin system mRNA interferase toxin, RelE/StbE family [Flammeovirga yaeyamensis]|uniref:Type II toxin-antitoxin system mRNA interferase toxin, RelE/StbE family n=1 Tax=Flammeovirga yaeyamensis TaxID=367791 RepID=A0AAX1NE65_9BACT|nr:type II toxin-antitoxin system RelE/ParE family toxin [Flammeovirga yaeyamensis]MBB3699551.1 mRNA interferase RelE/StbE [Flammeovirga yaeyamensis]NMF35194.1 type II toxin-antitoxin system RelE/ParE family toxin [Flammeovirga yaeyamensis]QWG04058.1 type II toxin-antitoxin system mRNA interferase toxin, RelE/StbE family [Flammeovirga yaeyamensis]
MSYSINFTKQAIKNLGKIKEPYYSKLKTAIINLSENPRPNACKKLKGRDAYRIEVVNYRIIYEIIDKELIIDVIDVGHRKDIYE